MAPFRKPSWLVVLFVFALAFVTKAAIVDSNAVRAESTDASDVEAPNPVPADSVNTGDAGRPKKCKKVFRRQDWRKMSKSDRLAYIKGTQCMQRLKPNLDIPHAKTRFDDFVGLHIVWMTRVHLVGQFLPWHRLLMAEYEKIMRNECGYNGAQPYWDWTYDVNNYPNAAVFDPVYGFGGVPRNGRAPIKDGPFAKHKLTFGIGGPEFNLTSHVLERGYNATQLKYLTTAEVKRVLSQPTFDQFRVQLEGWPVTSEPKMHDGGHYAVGGDLSDIWAAPNDPLFYVHHASLDRIWWLWQNSAPGRLFAISGPDSRNTPFKNVTLNTLLETGKLTKPTPIRDVMDIENSLCYTYV